MAAHGQIARSARCSDCGINYPPNKSVCEVRGCGVRLSPFLSEVPHEDWQERVNHMSTAFEEGEVEDPDGLRDWRVEKYENLGFPDYAALILAEATTESGAALWWGRVADALERGANHSQALRIFA